VSTSFSAGRRGRDRFDRREHARVDADGGPRAAGSGVGQSRRQRAAAHARGGTIALRAEPVNLPGEPDEVRIVVSDTAKGFLPKTCRTFSIASGAGTDPVLGAVAPEAVWVWRSRGNWSTPTAGASCGERAGSRHDVHHRVTANHLDPGGPPSTPDEPEK